MKQPCFVVQYTLDYQHRVQVGVVAKTSEEAAQKARQAFDSGTIWDDTAEMPLLLDAYEETDDNVLAFAVFEVSEWPAPEFSVVQNRRDQVAKLACRFLVDEVRAARAANRSVELTKAFNAALEALGMN